MRLFLDTEFTDLLHCDLISVGLVSEDGLHEFYGERSDFDRSLCSDFVRAAVLPLLGQRPAAIADETTLGRRLKDWLQRFADAAPVIVCVDHPTDWELFAYLVRDEDTLETPAWLKGQSIRASIDPAEVERHRVAHGHAAHHALHDAQALRAAWRAGACA